MATCFSQFHALWRSWSFSGKTIPRGQRVTFQSPEIHPQRCARPASLRASKPMFYACLTWGSASPKEHASPDSQISAAFRACRKLYSACASGYNCACACLLSAQIRASLPRVSGRGIRATRHPCHRLLQPGLRTRRNHIAVGKSTAARPVRVHAKCECANHRLAFELSFREYVRPSIHPRPSGPLHRLIKKSGRA
jgi:hypothetical protein